MRIDNLAREDHDVCPAKYDLRHNLHWTTRGRSPALGFGGVLHLGLGAWYRTHDAVEALKAIQLGWRHVPPVDDFRTLEKCLRVMTEYIKEYPSEGWKVVGDGTDEPLVEKAFTIDTGLYLPCSLSWLGDPTHGEPCALIGEPPESGETTCGNCGRELEPIEYGGIIDVVSEFSGTLYIVDHKTTTRMGEAQKYFRQFKPDNQMTGYIWGASNLTNQPVGGALINGIGLYKSQATKFERQLTTRSSHDLRQFLRDLHMKCIEIKTHKRLGIWPFRTKSCTLYGICEYHDVHSNSDPETQLKILEQQYVQRKWDYEARDLDDESST